MHARRAAARAPAATVRPSIGSALLGVKDQVPYMLSGGLTPDNVADAIRSTGAAIVDVSSGVEVRPGEKDPALIGRFLRAAKGAKQGA